MLSKIKKRKKKAVSLMVSYVLLIVITISLAVLVYAWLKFRVVPPKIEKCPEDVSLVIKDYSCNPSTKEIEITVENKGTHSIGGMTIKGTNKSSEQAIPTELLKINSSRSGYVVIQGKIYFDKDLLSGSNNSLEPNEEITIAGEVPYDSGSDLKKMQIVPFRIQETEEGKSKAVLCEGTALTEDVNCGGDAGIMHDEPLTGLISWWKFDEDAEDSQSGYNGENHGGTFSQGKVNNALFLATGSNSYVKISDKSNLKPADGLTIEFWVKPTSIIPGTILNKHGDYKISIISNKLQADIDGKVLTSATSVSIGSWTFVAVTWNKNDIKMYINGATTPEDSQSLNKIDYNTNDLIVGTDSIGNSNFVGLIDELKIYGSALSSDEISSHYTSINT